jgi:Putative zinc-finger
MNCEALQLNLSLYGDDLLSDEERAAIDGHLPACPVCREKAAELRSIRVELGRMSRPEIPADLLSSIRNAVNTETAAEDTATVPAFSEAFHHWLKFRLMPFGVGTIVSTAVAFSLLTMLLTTKSSIRGVSENQRDASQPTILMSGNTGPGALVPEELNSVDYAALHVDPSGALAALTRSLVRGKMKDEEVVVVADVFNSGIARISEVVEAPRDRQTLRDLENALRDDPTYAPLSPSENHNNVVRVVLKIQRVDVVDKPAKSRRR